LYTKIWVLSEHYESRAIATKRIFICGSALRGQPDHGQLRKRQIHQRSQNAPTLSLTRRRKGWHPAIYEVAEGGIAIPGEEYELTLQEFADLAASEPPHMYAHDVVIEDGETLTAFLYPRELVEKYQWDDISNYGGWAAIKQV
jgi:hypothetical protein